MSCSGSFITSYFFWAIPAGLFAGFAMSRLLRFPARSDIDARHWKWITFSLYLSAGVLFALCGAFIPSTVCSTPQRLRVSPEFLDHRILTTAGAAALAGLLGLRFKRVAGLPLLLLISVGTGAIPVIRHPWRQFEEGAPVAEVRLLSISNGNRSIEFNPRDGDTYFVELPGNGIEVEITVLQASDYYFFVDKPMMYRLKSIAPPGGSEQVYNVVDEGGDAGKRFQAWLQSNMQRLPGWDVRSIHVTANVLLPLFRYAVDLGGKDGPEIRLVRPDS
jgi:hypothetical protein